MKDKLDKGAHSVYTLQYHFVQVVKYRKDILTNDDMVAFIKEKVLEISDTFGVVILEQECDKDHIHIIFRGKPTLLIPKYINALKTITSREVRRNYPEIREKLWGEAFWSPSYFLATTGQVTLSQLKAYVEGQGKGRVATNL